MRRRSLRLVVGRRGVGPDILSLHRPIRAAVHAQVRKSSLLVASLILSFVCTGHGIPTKVQLLEAITAKRVESRLLGCAGAAAMLAAQIGLGKVTRASVRRCVSRPLCLKDADGLPNRHQCWL